jgi:hypothetical protein
MLVYGGRFSSVEPLRIGTGRSRSIESRLSGSAFFGYERPQLRALGAELVHHRLKLSFKSHDPRRRGPSRGRVQCDPRFDALHSLSTYRLISNLALDELAPAFFTLLVAIARTAGQDQIAEVISPTRCRVVHVCFASVPVKELPAVCAPAFEVIPDWALISWPRIDNGVDHLAHPILHVRHGGSDHARSVMHGLPDPTQASALRHRHEHQPGKSHRAERRLQPDKRQDRRRHSERAKTPSESQRPD